MQPTALRRSRFLAAFLVVAPLLIAADDPARPPRTLLAPGTRVAEPAVLPASNDGLNAIQRMKVPEGLEMKLWAAEPMLANPVAFNIDERGRIFVAETYRYRTSTLDIRDYRWMLEDELANRTIEDRTAMLRRHFGEEGLKELSIESELVRLVEDTDGDGTADRSTVYADGFSTPLDGIASGVMARRGKVWFTNIPSLWEFTGERRAETRTEVSRGYGVRFNFTGHDSHGLTLGPDGKIYFSFGDRGASVKTKEGTTIESPDTGAVFRMNLDGTELERVADGLRNPQSLLFTENGDLFTGDNDSDLGDEERLVQIVEGGDSGWRVGYQHPPLTNIERMGPWGLEKLWQPRQDSQPAYFLPPLCNIEDGPSGVAYYPGTGLNSSYAGTMFITDFKGAIARSGIYSYKVKQKGASYEIVDSKPFLTASLPTDVRFGYDGRVYISDWVDGWPKSKRGRIYAIYDPKHVNDPINKETQQIMGGDWTKRSTDELAKLLAHADWRVRLEAQYTLAERGAASVPVLARVATTGAPAARELGDPANLPAYARRHAIWGLGQIAAKNPEALASLRTLHRDADSEVRAQAIKVLGDRRAADQADTFLAALKDESARVKFFAAQSLGKVSAGHPEIASRAAPALFDVLRANNDADLYLRHAAVVALAAGQSLDALAKASQDTARPVRLGALLAYRRLGRAEIARFLSDADPYLVREAALAINDRPIVDAMPALAAMLDRAPTDESVLYRTINANYRLGQPANAAALVKFATLSSASPKMRTEAITQLSEWATPPARDRIVGIFRPIIGQVRTADPARTVLAPVVSSLLDPSAPPALRRAAITAIEKLQVASAADTLFAILRDEAQPEINRISALSALDKIQARQLAEAVRIASSSTTSRLRLAALPIAARLSPESAAPVLATFVAKGTPEEQKAAFEALGTLRHPSADTLLAEQLQQLAAGKVAPAAELELLEAAAKRDSAEIKKLLADRDARLASRNDPTELFHFALAGGNRERGQQLFESHPVMACMRCHRVGTGANGGDAGPNLADVGGKYSRDYLLEAIVKPNAKIAPGFDMAVITQKSGDVVAGMVVGETDGALSLRGADGTMKEVRKANISKRESAPSAMPEIYGALLTKSELRDILEYIAGLRPAGGFGGGGAAARGPQAAGAAGGAEIPPPRALRGLTTSASAPGSGPQTTHP